MATKNKKTVRKLHQPGYKSFRLQKRIKSNQPKLPSSWDLLKKTFNTLKSNKKFFGIITFINAIFSFIFIRSAGASVDVVGLKQTYQTILGQGGGLASDIALFGVLVGSSGPDGDSQGMYQIILAIVFSLALIYGLRHIYSDSKEKLSAKRSLYEGMAPIIPFILVLIVIGLQLLPLSIGSSLYSTVVNNGLAVSTLEKALWLIMLVLLCLLSLYMIASSIFALYIVTLPRMTPIKALRSARDLVRYRRWTVMRKIIALPIFVMLIFGLIILPMIALLPRFAEIVFFILTLLILPFVHAYIYSLYRKLL
ncbi:MAG TPA: hypothetical protein PKB09_04435 [Candidatus Saccharibacteria bacterium]|nr:hypothetical protein [Candidatus Saccharibacteria bacterium]